jgi:hypothetical protein
VPENVQEPRWLLDTIPDDEELLDDDDVVFRKYVVVEALDVTKKQLMRLATIDYGDYPIATMTIPMVGKATVHISNFFPPTDSVLSVLNPDVVDEDEGKIKVIKFATISFPDCDTEEGCVTEPSSASSTSTASTDPLESPDDIDDLDLPSVDTSRSSSRTINDAPIGLRLLNAYCKAHARYATLLIRPKGKESVKIPVDSEKGSWSSRYDDVGNIPAHFPRHSVLAAAVHTGPENLYGVAFSSLIVTDRMGKLSCMQGGVTILPPGKRWLHYALSCIGLQNRLKKEQDTSCKIVQTFLSGLKSLPINREEALINAINYIFRDWLEESD